jgi:hypothetical protein
MLLEPINSQPRANAGVSFLKRSGVDMSQDTLNFSPRKNDHANHFSDLPLFPADPGVHAENQ